MTALEMLERDRLVLLAKMEAEQGQVYPLTVEVSVPASVRVQMLELVSALAPLLHADNRRYAAVQCAAKGRAA